MGNKRFGAPRELVLWLSRSFGINTFVETGTNRAETTVWASDHFERVFTVEGYEPLYLQAVRNFGHRSNIRFLKGNSRDHIGSIVNSLTEPAIFWLDAHWCGEHTFGKTEECPVVAELEALNQTTVGHMVLVDDARLFLAPPPPPHDASHWVDISGICGLLSGHSSNRYVAIHEDVIVGVPSIAKLKFVEFLRNEMVRGAQSAGTRRWTLANVKRAILKRTLG